MLNLSARDTLRNASWRALPYPLNVLQRTEVDGTVHRHWLSLAGPRTRTPLCGGGLGSDHFLNQKDCAGGKRHNLGRLQTSQLPRVDGVCPPPREAVGTPGSYSPTWLGRADSQPSLSLQGDGSQGAWFHLYLISFCAGNLMDSLALRDEVPAGPG